MRKIIQMSALVAVASLAIVGSTLQAAPTPSDCTITTDGKIAVRAGEQELKVRTSEALEGALTASFPEDAKIQVTAVERQADGGITLKVTAEGAAVGTQALTIKAGAAECKGDISVVTAE